jgi:hypothetical protein
MALHRCRELAGVRIQLKCKDCAPDEEKSLVAASVGAAAAPDPVTLVRGGADGFRALLQEWGVGSEQATSLQQMLEVFAARTLFDRRCPELPSGFVAAVEKAKEVSDVLVIGT